MKVMLATPPYHSLIVEAAGTWPPLAFVYIGGALREAGHEAEIYDAASLNHTMEEILEHICEVGPDVVATTAYTSSANDAIRMLAEVKKISPDIITVMGGVHAHFMYDEILRGGAVDFIIRSEGEHTMPELLDTLMNGESLSQVRGIAYIEDGQVICNPDRPLIEDLDALPAAWDLLEWGIYKLNVVPNTRIAVVSSSRGCPHNCIFCSQQKFWDKSYRQRDPTIFVDEIEYLNKEYGANVFLLSDEYPTRDGERWEKILNLLIERDLGVMLLLETRASDIVRDRDIMWKYQKAGIFHVYVGVEAANQDTLDLLRKDISCDEGLESIRLINEAGMISECSFVLGMPDETPESIQKTLELSKTYNPDCAHYLLVAPWPYADLYQEIKEMVVEHDYSKYNFINPIVKPHNMSPEELREALKTCYKEFYMDKLPQLDSMPPDKRDYMINTLHIMIEQSFIREFVGDLGDIPEEVERYLKKYLGDNTLLDSDKASLD